MAKAEWGIKRLCQSCHARFYDMQRTPIICPACGAAFDPEAAYRSRRGRAAPEKAPREAAKAPVADVEEEPLAAADDVDDSEEEDLVVADDEEDPDIAIETPAKKKKKPAAPEDIDDEDLPEVDSDDEEDDNFAIDDDDEDDDVEGIVRPGDEDD